MSKSMVYGRETRQQDVRFKVRTSVPKGFGDARGRATLRRLKLRS